MTIEVLESQNAGSSTGNVFSLRVAILHEDFKCGLRAMECLDRLARNLNVESNVFVKRFWSLDILGDPAARKETAREARDYEIILLSLPDSGEPRYVLKQWLGEWLECRRRRPCALAVLFDEKQRKPGGDARLLKCLADVAELGGLDLVCPLSETAGLPARETLRQIASRAINASPILGEIVEDWGSQPHFGGNDWKI